MQFVVLLLIIGLSALGYYFRKDILVSYHKWGQESALKSMRKYSIGDRGEHKISITCRKEWMPTMEELIEKYDVPPDDPI